MTKTEPASLVKNAVSEGLELMFLNEGEFEGESKSPRTHPVCWAFVPFLQLCASWEAMSEKSVSNVDVAFTAELL